MAKGSKAKEEFINWILEHYDGAFIASDGKTLRVPVVEDGEAMELKIALTKANDIEGNGSVITEKDDDGDWDWSDNSNGEPDVFEPAKISEEEQDNIRKMMERLGL